MPRRAVATILVFLLAGILLPARPAGTPTVPPLGIVTQATSAHFNAARVSSGATIYDGDALSTDAEGALQFRAPAAQVYLPGSSAVTLHALPSGAQSRLNAGTLVFSTAKAVAMEILVDEARIRSLADGPTIAQVTRIGPKELRIRARRGALHFSYREEEAKIPDGASYRILLDPPGSTPTFPPGPPKEAAREGKFFTIIVIVSVGWATEWGLHEVFESPDRP